MIVHGSTDGWRTLLVDSRRGTDHSGDPQLTVAHSYICSSKGLNARIPGNQADCIDADMYQTLGGFPLRAGPASGDRHEELLRRVQA